MQSPLKIQGTAKMWSTNCPGRARHGHRLRATPKTRHRDTGSERLAGGRPGRAPGTRTGHTDAGARGPRTPPLRCTGWPFRKQKTTFWRSCTTFARAAPRGRGHEIATTGLAADSLSPRCRQRPSRDCCSQVGNGEAEAIVPELGTRSRGRGRGRARSLGPQGPGALTLPPGSLSLPWS